MSLEKAIDTGLKYAAEDYGEISAMECYDVKPKEDQVKCCLYRALSESGFTVHVEASYARNGGRCDLVAIDPPRGTKVAIEIKTAWAGAGWVNKPKEQVASWRKDIDKLKALQENGCADKGLLILCFAYERDSQWHRTVRNEIEAFGGTSFPPFSLSEWNGLNEAHFITIDAFAG